MPEWVVSAQEEGKPGVAKWSVEASSPLGAIDRVAAEADSLTRRRPSTERQQLRQAGQDVIELAAGLMDAQQFRRDERVKRAAHAMGMTVGQALDWATHL